MGGEGVHKVDVSVQRRRGRDYRSPGGPDPAVGGWAYVRSVAAHVDSLLGSVRERRRESGVSWMVTQRGNW